MRVSDLNIDRIYINSEQRDSDYKMVDNHFHYYYEIYYVRSGKIRFYVDNSLYTLKSGDIMIIPPHMIHFVTYLSNCVRVNIYFKIEDLVNNEPPFMPNFQEKFLKLTTIHIPRAYRDNMNTIIDTMLHEDTIDDTSTKMMLSLLLKQFLLSCNRYCVFNITPDGYNEDEYILKAVQYINENFHSNITLTSMAEMAGLSPSYFSKKFKATTGSGMKEYLTYVRLNHASMELISTDHSITNVALNCGFSDSNYFKDSFKKTYGMSPRAYRNSKSTKYIMPTDISAQNRQKNDQ